MAEAAAGQGSVRPRRRASELRVDHQPGAVLHTMPWRETSLIVEVFTRDFGRLPLVARGAKRPTSQFRGLLSPFAPLALAWSGRGEIKNLVRVEWSVACRRCAARRCFPRSMRMNFWSG